MQFFGYITLRKPAVKAGFFYAISDQHSALPVWHFYCIFAADHQVAHFVPFLAHLP